MIPSIVYILEKGGHNTRRPDSVNKKIGKFFSMYLNNDNLNATKLGQKINLEDENEENLIKEENENILIEDSNDNDKYMEKIEENEQMSFDEMKSCLLKINPDEEIKSVSCEGYQFKFNIALLILLAVICL